MLPLRYARLWRVANMVLLSAVLAATIMPAVWLWPDRVRIVNWADSIDKWAHFVTFAFLAVWFAGQYPSSRFWRIGFWLLAFGVAIELLQRAVGYRSAEWLDIAADAAGIIAGFAIALTGVAGWSLRAERLFAGNSND